MTIKSNIGRTYVEKMTNICHMQGDYHLKIDALRVLYDLFFEAITENEPIHFSTLFSRIAFVGHKYQLSSKLKYHLHSFRKVKEDRTAKEFFESGFQALRNLILRLFSEIQDAELPSFDLLTIKNVKPSKRSFISNLKGVVTQIDFGLKTFQLISFDNQQETLVVKYKHKDIGESFMDTLEKAWKLIEGPLSVNLVNVDFDETDTAFPKAIIIEPDFLIDVTAISELNKEEEHEKVYLYLLKKFIPVDQSKALILGNISNYLLDSLVSDGQFNLDQQLHKIFSLYPIFFSNKDDSFVREIVNDVKVHFRNLQKVVSETFEELGIEREHLYVEPSFYDVHHGIQGRLDLLQKNDQSQKMDIIELKSGKIFRPNAYGLNANHYTQTLLYDLMIKTIYRDKYKNANYILYSREAQDALRFAPTVRAQQVDALSTRNNIFLIEKYLAKSFQENGEVLKRIAPENFPNAKGFVKNNLVRFKKAIDQSSPLIQKYFRSHVAFVAGEQHLAKLGKHGFYNDNGFASLWLENIEEKERNFTILRNLTIQENLSHEPQSILVLKRTKETNALANFRQGDIAILYPSNTGEYPLCDQIFKCSLIEISNETISVQLRSIQTNQRIFEQNSDWNIEMDHLDSGYNHMYRSLFRFLESSQRWKDLWTGKIAPRQIESDLNLKHENLTEEQNRILGEMVSSEDYYLLWGPPGTGKTSVMLKHFVEHHLHNSDECLLLLAYTNKAVDEMCKAVESIEVGMKAKYLRIGSSYACDPQFQENLLQNRIKSLRSRKDVKTFIQSKKIILGTLSSMSSKTEIFKLLNISTVVIDEASQILDPLLSGLLSNFKKFVLIGDHHQLPAVVKQAAEDSLVKDDELKEVGITDLSQSSFERLYRRASDNGWDWAIGMLGSQGRMHQSLMEFPNLQFYKNELAVLDKLDRLRAPIEEWETASILGSRTCFINAKIDQGLNVKTNVHEARIIGQLLLHIKNSFENKGLNFAAQQIGIVTPYRAQIAQIKKELSEVLPLHDFITIDTVERYQGGSKDIIILSFCVNDKKQLENLVSLSYEGVDRKLNVALTRAKEQIVLIGNREVLSSNQLYKDLLDSYQTFDSKLL